MFIWNQQKKAIYLNGSFLLTHPETGQRWISEAQAASWWQESDYNPDNIADEATEHQLTVKSIKVTGITAAQAKPEDFQAVDRLKITLLADKSSTLSGEIDIEDGQYYVPFKRDDGRTFEFAFKVTKGKFTAALVFTEAGRYQLDLALFAEEVAVDHLESKDLTIRVVPA